MPKDKFITRIQKQNEEIKKYSQISNFISTARTINFLAILFFVYPIIKTGGQGSYVIAECMMLILFISLIIYHRNIKDKLYFSNEIVNINKQYLNRIDGNWVNSHDIGEEFIDKKHKYSLDLDIVGQRSLFQLINVTNTWNGRAILAKALLEPKYNKDKIILRQQAVKELSTKLDFCQNLQFICGNQKLKNPQKLIQYAERKDTFIKSYILKKAIYYTPIISILTSLSIIIFKVEKLYPLITAFILIHLLILAIGFSINSQILEEVQSFKYDLEGYIGILSLLEKESFECAELNHLQKILFNEKHSATLAIKQLDNILSRINLRYNPILYLLLNGLLLWDYECVFRLENWKRNYGLDINKWLEAIGEIEALMSLSVLMQINDTSSFPIIDNSNLRVKAECLGHPLINNNERILNDIDLNDHIFIITGSNMSGKTTFLRTLGINLVLAYSGAPVYAHEMLCPILDIFTSMRITDDLKNGISTFYAELLRIKDIINHTKNNHHTIFLIDEIFRGTNSVDRILGAKNVLANLNELGVIGAITTHDLELCTFSKYDRIQNYHFSEQYKDNKICFDYKFKNGKSTSTNARYLMDLVGIKILEG